MKNIYPQNLSLLEYKVPPLWKQVRALVWKNYILKKRHLFITLVELLCPVFYGITFLASTGIFAPKDTATN